MATIVAIPHFISNFDRVEPVRDYSYQNPLQSLNVALSLFCRQSLEAGEAE